MKVWPWLLQGATSPAHLRLPMLALLALGFSGALISVTANAQSSAPAKLSLRQAFEAAVSRLPETRSAPQRRDAAAAHQRAAQRWTPEPASLDASIKTDRIGANNGSREWVAGLSVPLWMPGQRDAAQSLALAEADLVGQALTASSWRVAGEVRDAWWAAQLAQLDLELAQTRLGNAERLEADVALRVRAGDLARSDQHQASAAVAAAQAELVSAKVAQGQALRTLRSLTGPLALALLDSQAEPLPRDTFGADKAPADNLAADTAATNAAVASVASAAALAMHPALREARARVELARRAGSQARLQRRAAPELALAATRGRGSAGEAYGQSITIGLRLPLGADDRHQAQLANTGADLTEAESRLAIERERIEADIAFAHMRLALARSMVDTSARRAVLASESRGFFDKAFRLGEMDLPARLRIELEAVEAERQHARARIELAHATSQWRQALGLNPV